MNRSLSNNRLSTLASDTVSTSAESEISASNNNYGNFADGTFEELGSLQQQIASTIFPNIDDAAVQNWIAQIQDPSQLVSFLWDVSGNVQLVREGSNTLIELNQTNNTSLGQLLNLNNNPTSLEFDLSILSVGTDDKLQVVFKDDVLAEFALTNIPANGHYSVSLSGLGFQSGELTFRLIGPTDTSSVVRLDNLSVLDVVSGNRNPVANNDKTLNILEDSASTPLNITTPTDLDGDLLTITIDTVPDASKGEVRLSNGTIVTIGSTLTIEQLTGLVFVPLPNAGGNAETFSYTVSDGQGGADSQIVTLEITPVNDAPTVQNAIADRNATEDSIFSFTVPANAFADIDAGDTLTYSATLDNGDALPSWLTFNASTKTFSGVPADENVGAIDIKVTATDASGASVSDIFKLTVANINDAPILVDAIADQTATEDSSFSFTVPSNSFKDFDLVDTLTYAATLENGASLPSWLTFDAATRTFFGTPGNNNVGAIDIKVTATDTAGASISDTFKLTITNVNDAPTLENAIADRQTITTQAFSLTLSADTFKDIDAGDTLTYSATLENGDALPSWLTFDAATRTFSGTPNNGDAGILNVQVTATDSQGLSVSDSFALDVLKLIPGTFNNDTLTGTNNVGDYILGREGRDILTGLSGNDILVGGAGSDVLTGGMGKDWFVYTNFRDIGDTIKNFELGNDKIILTDLLDSLGYGGSNPLADGYVKWVQGSNGTSIQIDPDGAAGSGIYRPFITLENVAASNVNASHFVF
jgi:Putative Ig domain/Bacterial Ig domain/RTX calcium-binding nonapeptide repeat (4 copies)